MCQKELMAAIGTCCTGHVGGPEARTIGRTCVTARTSAGDACLHRRRSSAVTAGNMLGTSAQSSTLQPLLSNTPLP